MNLVYHSTRNSEETATASEAILKGLTSDGGLFVPDSIPKLNVSLEDLTKMSYQEIAYAVMKEFLTDFTEDELVGNWEHIDLSYSYGKQKTSNTMTLSADHKVTDGSWKGATWNYDTDNQRITFSNGVEVCLQREVDWEASPRTHTIVYAGYTNSKTYWGKKKK